MNSSAANNRYMQYISLINNSKLVTRTPNYMSLKLELKRTVNKNIFLFINGSYSWATIVESIQMSVPITLPLPKTLSSFQ